MCIDTRIHIKESYEDVQFDGGVESYEDTNTLPRCYANTTLANTLPQ